MAIGLRLTTTGAVLLAKAITGSELVFTRGAFGDAIINGELVNPTDKEQDLFTKLIHEKMSLPIAAYQVDTHGQLVVTLQVKNDKVKAGFRIAEYGLFAIDPDTSKEVLYGYCYEGTNGDRMHGTNTSVILEYAVEMVTTIGNAANVYAIIDKSTIGITREEFEEHIYSSDPHPNMPRLQAGRGLTRTDNTFDVNIMSPTLHGGAKVGEGLVMNEDSLSADLTPIENLVAQIFANQSNLYFKLNTDDLVTPITNLLFAENFSTNKFCDLLKIEEITARRFQLPWQDKVTNNILSDNPAPLKTRLHSDYTILTPSFQEEHIHTSAMCSTVRSATSTLSSQAIAYGPGDLQSKTHTHNTLYRTTASVEGAAYGPAEWYLHTYTGNKIWRGEAAQEPDVVTMIDEGQAASPRNHYTLSGDWAFNSDNLFTLE